MSANIQEQISAAVKSQLETRLASWAALDKRAVEAAIKLVDLNAQVTKESLAQSAVTTRRLLSAHDPHEFFSLIGEQFWPSVDKVLAYTRQVAEIGAGMRTEISKVTKDQMTDANREAAKLAEQVGRAVPTAAGNIFGFMQSEADNANAGYAQIEKASQENTQAAQASVPTSAQRAPSGAKKETSRAKKK